MSRKCLFLAKWTILDQLVAKIMEAYITGPTLRAFSTLKRDAM